MNGEVTKNQLMTVIESINDKFQQVLECFGVLDRKIDGVEERLTEKIEVLDAKVMGLAKRLDTVEAGLSHEIAEVRADLADHRTNTEMHRAPLERTLKKAV